MRSSKVSTARREQSESGSRGIMAGDGFTIFVYKTALLFTFSTKKYVSRETLGRNTNEKMVQYFIGVRSNLLLLRKGH